MRVLPASAQTHLSGFLDRSIRCGPVGGKLGTERGHEWRSSKELAGWHKEVRACFTQRMGSSRLACILDGHIYSIPIDNSLQCEKVAVLV
jgi:hypothetical protein